MNAAFAWLWQGLLLAAVVDLLLRAMPRLNAATRHVAWWATLAGIVVLGVMNATGGSTAALPAAAAPQADATAIPAWPAVTLPHAPGWLVTSALWAWALLALWRLGVVVRGLRHVAALRDASVPVDAERMARLAGWSAARNRGGRRASLHLTDQRVGACALGFRRPVILVSRQWLETLDDEVLDQVVMHEQAHLDRFDDWLRLVQAVVAAVAAPHPAVHLVARRIDLEREAACDDRVVSATGRADRYATCLAEAASINGSRVPAAVPAVLGGSRTPGRSLRSRVVRLLDPRLDRGRRIARPVAATVAAWLVAVLVVAPQLPAFVVFAHAMAPALGVTAVHAGYSTAVPEASMVAPAPVGTAGPRVRVSTRTAATADTPRPPEQDNGGRGNRTGACGAAVRGFRGGLGGHSRGSTRRLQRRTLNAPGT